MHWLILFACSAYIFCVSPAYSGPSDQVMHSLLTGSTLADHKDPHVGTLPKEQHQSGVELLLSSYKRMETAAFKDLLIAAAIDHPARLSSGSRRHQAQANVDEANAARYPIVEGDFTAGGTYLSSNGDGLNGSSRDGGIVGDFDASITLRQLLYDFGAVSERQAASASFLLQAQLGESEVAQERVVIAAEAYFRVLSSIAEQALAIASMRRLEELKDMVEERYYSGAATVADVLRANAQISAARSDQVLLERQIAEAQSAYLEAFGSAHGELMVPVIDAILPSSLEDARRSAVSGRDQMLAINSLRDGRRAEYAAATADLWPRFNLEASAASLNINEGGEFSGTVRVRMQWSLFDGGLKSAREGRALAAYQEASYQQVATQRQLEHEAYAAYSAYEAIVRQSKIATVATREAEQARDAAREQFAVRGITILDVLTAERDALRAGSAWLHANLDVSVAKIRLLRASGKLPDWFGADWAFRTSEAAN